MSLCLSMIVKNEAHVIRRCLRSVKPFIDSYSISDTGSTDDTMDIILEELAGIPGVLESDPWQDFSANRNLALSRATGDHVLLIDADEVLEHTGGEIVLDSQYDAFRMKFMSPSTVYYKIKIVRNDPGWRYHGKTHEYLGFDGNSNEINIPNLAIADLNDGSSRITGEKWERDLKIFESEPPTPRNVFYHARTLTDMGRKEEAIKKYYERATLGDWEEEVYYSLWRAADLMGPERQFSQIAGALYRAYIYRPSRYEALVKLCQILREHGQFEEIFRLSLVEPKPSKDILFVDHRSEWIILIEHAWAAYKIGKNDEAQEYFDRIANITPTWTSAENFVNLSLVYYQTKRYTECISAAREALKYQPNYAEAYNNIAVSYMALGQWDLAIEAANEAIRLSPNFQLAINNLNAAIAEKAKLEATENLDMAEKTPAELEKQNLYGN